MFALIIGYCLTAFFVVMSLGMAWEMVRRGKIKDEDGCAIALLLIVLFAFLALGTAKLAGI